MMLQTMNFNRWSDFVCDAPHIMVHEVAGSRVLRNTRSRTRRAAMEQVIQKTVGVERSPWAVATMV